MEQPFLTNYRAEVYTKYTFLSIYKRETRKHLGFHHSHSQNVLKMVVLIAAYVTVKIKF